jgi:large-conductance mechanosensitive channel
MAIKYDVTIDNSGFLDGMHKVQDSVKETGKAIEDAFDGGNIDNASQSLRARMRMLTQEIASLTVEYRNLSESEQKSAHGQELRKKIENLTTEAGTLRDAMDDVNRSVRGVASDTKNWDALAGGINVATSAFGALTGTASLFGAEEEKLQEIQTKLQASLAISNALSVIQNNLQKESNLMLGIRAIKEKAAAVAIAIRSAAEGKGVITTKAATIAQGAFNLVAKANPYVLLATAILTVVGALTALTMGNKKAKESQEKLNKAQEEAKKMLKNLPRLIRNGQTQLHRVRLSK